MTNSALKLPALNYHNDYESQANNTYQIYPEKKLQNKTNHKHNLAGRPFTQVVSDTFLFLQKIDPLAACLWFTMISLPEHWHYRIPDLAKRIGICENTCRLKMNTLINLGLVNRKKIAGGQTEYEVFQATEDNPLKSQSTTKSLDQPTLYNKKEIFKDKESNNTTKTSFKNKYSITTTSNNIISSKSIPNSDKTVVVNTKISKTDSPVRQGKPCKPELPVKRQNPTVKFPSEKVNSAIEKIELEKRKLINKAILYKYQNDYSDNQIADFCIYALNHARNPNEPNGYLRRMFENEWQPKPQEYYYSYDTKPKTEFKHEKFSDFKSRIDEKINRISVIAEKERSKREKKPIEPIETKVEPFEMGYSLSEKLRKNKSDPIINEKYLRKNRTGYWDRRGRKDVANLNAEL